MMQIVPGIYLLGSQDCFLTYTDWFSPDCEYVDCNVFAVDLGEEVILFDSGNGASLEQIFSNARLWGLDVERITHCLLTHPHYDHSAGAYHLKERGVKIAAHTVCAEAVRLGDERTCSYLYHRSYVPSEVDIEFADEDRFSVGGLLMEIIHTPGHAEGSVVYSFRWRDRLVFVTGDLVAESGSLGWSGSIDFDPAAYVQSLKRLSGMRVDILLPGHRRPALSRGRVWVEQALNRALMEWGSR
jgi:glyoxylase-like metal-dependent hydrolase (beta-lactamase superfamily II)